MSAINIRLGTLISYLQKVENSSGIYPKDYAKRERERDKKWWTIRIKNVER